MKNIYLVIFQSKIGQCQVVSAHSTMDGAIENLKVVALEYAKQNDLEKYLNFIYGTGSTTANIISPDFPKNVYWWNILEMKVNP